MGVDFRWPAFNEQTAAHLASLVWRPTTRTVADMRVHEIVYIRLFATCSTHGDFSAVFAEDEVVKIDDADGLVRITCPAAEHGDTTRLCPATAFGTTRNPYRKP